MVKRLQHTELLSVYLQSLSTNNYIIMKKRDTYLFAAVLSLACATPSEACTGITLKTADGNTVVARTIEWNGNDLNSRLIVVPRKHKQNAITPSGKKEGMTIEAKYGYVGMAVEMEEFVVEGINEAGLSAGLFYFPKYGKYEQYDPRHKSMSVGDLQLVPWILGNFKTIDEMKTAIAKIHIVTIDSRASTAHWRIIDSSGRQVVLEITDGKPAFYENTRCADKRARLRVAHDKSQQLHQSVPRHGKIKVSRRDGTELHRSRKRSPRTSGRFHTAFTLHQGRILPDHGAKTSDSGKDNNTMLPHIKQL